MNFPSEKWKREPTRTELCSISLDVFLSHVREQSTQGTVNIDSLANCWFLFFAFLSMPIMWHECDMCLSQIRKCRLAINLVWCLWLHFLIIIPACPWVLIAFWILIFDVVCLLRIRPLCLFRILPNTSLKDEWACWIHARSYRLKLNYLNLAYLAY